MKTFLRLDSGDRFFQDACNRDIHMIAFVGHNSRLRLLGISTVAGVYSIDNPFTVTDSSSHLSVRVKLPRLRAPALRFPY